MKCRIRKCGEKWLLFVPDYPGIYAWSLTFGGIMRSFAWYRERLSS